MGGQFCCVGGRAVRRSSGTNRHIQCSAVGDDVTWKLLPQLAVQTQAYIEPVWRNEVSALKVSGGAADS